MILHMSLTIKSGNHFWSVPVCFSCVFSILNSILMFYLYILKFYLCMLIWFYHLQRFLYGNYHSVTKKSRAISCHAILSSQSILLVPSSRLWKAVIEYFPSVSVLETAWSKAENICNSLVRKLWLTLIFFKLSFVKIMSPQICDLYDNDDDELFLWYGWPTKGI